MLENVQIKISEAARLVGVSEYVLRKWSDEGTIPCFKSARGVRYFARADVEKARAEVLAMRQEDIDILGSIGNPRAATAKAPDVPQVVVPQESPVTRDEVRKLVEKALLDALPRLQLVLA